MLVNSHQGMISGLEDIDGDIRRSFGDGANSQLKRLSILAKFFSDTKIDENYDFIIFDCPPTNNYVTQNALFVSDYYLVPTVMDEMGIRGANHVRNIIEKKEIFELCRSYHTLIEKAPDSSYLSYLKSGTPKMIGIVETLKKSATDTRQLRQQVEQRFENMLFESVIENQVDISRSIGNGECCFEKPKGTTKVKPNEMYAKFVFELIERLEIEKNKAVRKINDYL